MDAFFEFSLLGLLASGYLAVAGSGYLDTPTAVLTGLGLLARAVIAAGFWRPVIHPMAVNAVTLGYVAFYPVDYYFLSHEFLTATVHLVFFLAVVRIFTATTDRDFLYVKIIAFLELLAASILSASANFFAFLILFLFFAVATFTAAEIRGTAAESDAVAGSGRRPLAVRLATLTFVTMAGILLLTGMFFVFLPRTARAAFQRFVPERYHLPGFSNEVSLGEIGELKIRSTVVMHAKISHGRVPSVGLKWRGSALSEFDGRRWYNSTISAEPLRVEGGSLRLSPREETLQPGWRISYEVVMQENTADILFFPGIPESIHLFANAVIRTANHGYRVGSGPSGQLRYRADSVLEVDGDPTYRGERMSAPQRSRHLRLPLTDERIAQLARQVTMGLASSNERARRLESFLRESYSYTLELPREESAEPLANFLFERKKGHCEYFASALAVMLRTVGIPSRVATGFQSGVYNPLSGWYVIRASDAHSWVEAWLEGKGWTTLDPTPADLTPHGFSLTEKLQLYMDAMQVFWQDWVLGYDIERQLTLAERMDRFGRSFPPRWLEDAGRQVRNWHDRLRERVHSLGIRESGIFLVALAGLLSVPLLVRKWVHAGRQRRAKRGQASASDATLLYRRMEQILRKRKLERPAWVTPLEFAAMPRDAETAAVLRDFTAAYNELRFGNRIEAAPRLAKLLEAMERRKRR
ncbi:MAG: DUF3488 domain-containing protein [Candidatus Solibacter usitatus]|nr:DUF3488 domain-containing protein [Candidatus Solibacter usitatus]